MQWWSLCCTLPLELPGAAMLTSACNLEMWYFGRHFNCVTRLPGFGLINLALALVLANRHEDPFLYVLRLFKNSNGHKSRDFGVV